MVVRIARKRMYLWRAVDHEGEILDILVQRRRDKRAALRLMRKLLRKQGFAPKLIVTDKLRSYGAAFHDLHLTCRHEQGLRMNLSVSPFRGVASLDAEHLLGVLSMIFWALIIVVAVKYVLLIMRADNQGEGGILALLALALE